VSRVNRVLASLLLAALLAFVGLYFGPALLSGFIQPLAEQLWGFLRVYILCINQEELWRYFVLALSAFLCYRLLRALASASREAEPAPSGPDANAALGELRYWRYLFTKKTRDERERVLARREFERLLVSAYAAHNRVEADFELLESFRSGRIPLPATVHSFLFGEEAEARPRKGARRLKAWLDRVSGRESSDSRRAVEEYLDYIESLMEMDDDGR
jgi:hypothetical protein